MWQRHVVFLALEVAIFSFQEDVMTIAEYIPWASTFQPRHIIGTLALLVAVCVYLPNMCRLVKKYATKEREWPRPEDFLAPGDGTIWELMLVPFQLATLMLIILGPFVALILFLAWFFDLL